MHLSAPFHSGGRRHFAAQPGSSHGWLGGLLRCCPLASLPNVDFPVIGRERGHAWRQPGDDGLVGGIARFERQFGASPA